MHIRTCKLTKARYSLQCIRYYADWEWRRIVLSIIKAYCRHGESICTIAYATANKKVSYRKQIARVIKKIMDRAGGAVDPVKISYHLASSLTMQWRNKGSRCGGRSNEVPPPLVVTWV